MKSPCTPGISSPNTPSSVGLSASMVLGCDDLPRQRFQRNGSQLGLSSCLSSAPIARTSSVANDTMFNCKKCKLQLAVAEMDGDKKEVCKTNVRSYKSFQERWTKDRKLCLFGGRTHRMRRRHYGTASSGLYLLDRSGTLQFCTSTAQRSGHMI